MVTGRVTSHAIKMRVNIPLQLRAGRYHGPGDTRGDNMRGAYGKAAKAGETNENR